jgi:hypothetical protein
MKLSRVTIGALFLCVWPLSAHSDDNDSDLQELIALLKDREQYVSVGYNEQAQALVSVMQSSGLTEAIQAVNDNAPAIPQIMQRIQQIDEGRNSNAARLTVSEALLKINDQRISNLEEERKSQRIFNKSTTETISSLGEGFRILGNSFKLKTQEYDKYEKVLWAFVGSIPAQILAAISVFKWFGNRKRDRTLELIASKNNSDKDD